MQKDWWKKFFGPGYLSVWEAKAIGPAVTKKEIDFLVKNLKLKKGQKILDLCCGQGRHSIELARRGYKVVGVDYSKYLLGVAKKRAKEAGIEIEFKRQDARNLKLKGKFDVVINMFTAFGYLENDRENEKIIKNVSQVLKKGGFFFLDFINSVNVLMNFQPRGVKTYSEKMKLIDERYFDPIKFAMISKWAISYGGKMKKFNGYIRFYIFPEFKTMFEKYGLKIIKTFGNFKGEKFSPKTKRLIIIAKKV